MQQEGLHDIPLDADAAAVSHAGMPEEAAIVKSALARSIDVLALTPKEQTYRCWDTEWPSKSEDIPRVGPHLLPNLPSLRAHCSLAPRMLLLSCTQQPAHSCA